MPLLFDRKSKMAVITDFTGNFTSKHNQLHWKKMNKLLQICMQAGRQQQKEAVWSHSLIHQTRHFQASHLFSSAAAKRDDFSSGAGDRGSKANDLLSLLLALKKPLIAGCLMQNQSKLLQVLLHQPFCHHRWQLVLVCGQLLTMKSIKNNQF